MTDFVYTSFDEANKRTLQYVTEFIDAARARAIVKTSIDTSLLPKFEKYYEGKVRDVYICQDRIVFVTTDRQSAFDRHLAAVPFKGQVLNMTSLWWFHASKHLLPNHVLFSPHPNITIGKRCTIFPIEFVMRGYITGSTSTSLWTNYNKGVRQYCGHTFPDGLRKNQKLDSNKLTPTTKSDEHDELISAEEIIERGIMTKADWNVCSQLAHTLFEFGQQIASAKGLILVDTKYEFGRDIDGNIIVVDEIHTPDSSRYWVSESYDRRMERGEEPDNIDKEFLRKWYASKCDPYTVQVLPEAPPELVNELSRRYIMLYEIITGRNFKEDFVLNHKCYEDMNQALKEYFAT